jgi:dTDP-4-amino-4,6-dideoxygalactose transaminase
LNLPRTVPTFSVAVAVYQAVRSLCLPRESVVLCPSYNCGHEIEAIIRLGLRVECYRVGTDMEADLDDIRRRLLGDVKAVLVTHYFGFAQPLDELRALCDRHGVFLIEDCAHALLSDDSAGTLGQVGDAAVFNLRKTLPLPSGGAVLFNHPDLRMDASLATPPRLAPWLKGITLMRKAAVDRLRDEPTWGSLTALAGLVPIVALNGALARMLPLESAATYDPDDEDFGFDSRMLAWGISPFSMKLLSRLDWSTIAERRRDNFRYLANELDRLEGCRLIYDDVSDFTCPLYLPIRVIERERLFMALVQRGIHSAVWWDACHPVIDWDAFPEAVELKNHVLALPVHQDLTDAQLEYIIATLGQLVGTTTRRRGEFRHPRRSSGRHAKL